MISAPPCGRLLQFGNRAAVRRATREDRLLTYSSDASELWALCTVSAYEVRFQVHEIICPNCGRAFAIDETGYADILKQVGDRDLEKPLHERLEPAERDNKNNLKLAQAHAEAEWVKLLSELEQANTETTPVVELAEAKLAAKLMDQLAEKAADVEKLKASIQASEQARQLAVIEATTRVEKERDRLKADLELAEAQKALGEMALQEKYEQQIKDRDDAIERLRDMKAKLSTQMAGETFVERAA